MSNLIIEQIERRARLEHGGDFTKAATEYFRDHPQYYKDEVAGVNKRADEDRERVNATVQYRIEMVACRDKLDLTKPADRATAQARALAEDPTCTSATQPQTPCVLASHWLLFVAYPVL